MCLTAYKVRDPLLMAVLRSVWLYTAAYNIDLQVKHIKGLNNVYADILSRWRVYKDLQTSEVQILKNCLWQVVNSEMLLPDFQI